MSRLALAVFAALALVAGSTASAQELNLATTSTARPSIVAVRTGVDHAFVGEVGYRHVLAWGDRQLFVGGDFAMPWAEPDLHDYRLRATVGMPFGAEHWKVAAWLSPTLRGTENAASELVGLGVDLRLTGGYCSRRWFAGAEVGLDWAAATHIGFNDEYRRQFAGAKDGWYGATGGTAYTGVHAGLSFSSVDLVVRAGLPRSPALEQQSIPLYVTVGVNVTLPR
jgi:hypothetical protein